MKPKKSISLAVILIVAILVLPALGASAKEKDFSAIPKAEALSKLSKLHIPFIPNQGQIDERVKYYARTFGGTVFVSEAGEILYSLPKREGEEKTFRGWVLKEELLGGSIKEVRAEEQAPTKVSYFMGDDASKWRSDIATYGTVSFGEVYEGIEVKVKAYGKSVEKLFYVRAGAKPGLIRLRLSGAESLGVNGEGELEVRTGLGEVKFSRPVAYQEVEGKKRYVEVSYQVEENDYGFKLGDYDRERELVIDPILQSTYLGGSDYESGAYSIAIDSDGNVYVAGGTISTDFPGTTGSFQRLKSGSSDVFIAKLDPTLTKILQSTYLGDLENEYAYSLAIDSEGNVYVTGYTQSLHFPFTTGGAQFGHAGGTNDAFVAKLNSGLTTLIQSTYLGGSGSDIANSLAIDSEGNVYVAGGTTSTNFNVTAGGAQTSFGGGGGDAFVAKLNPDLTTLLQSTYLGGSGGEEVSSIAIGSGGTVYVAGVTDSTNFPDTAGGAQTSYGGGRDAFVARLNPGLTQILQSTYLGGSGDDFYAKSIAIGPGGNVYVAGATKSADFPGTAGGAQPSKGASEDAFVARFNPGLTDLVQSTYLGGSGFDYGYSIAIGSGGSVYVAGLTFSGDFPGTAGGPQPLFGGANGDAYVARLNPGLTALTQSTYLGGSSRDEAISIAIDSEGNVYVAGATESTNFPGTAGRAQPSYGGGRDAFVARLYPELTEPPGAATLVSPSGTVDTKTPTYTWNAVALAAEYDLRVNDSTGNRILQWYSASEVGCASGEPTCSVTPATALAAGPGKWWIQTKNSAGTGPLSSPMSFTVEAVSAPTTPEGPKIVERNTTYYYYVRGSASNANDPIEYLFDWGDGTNSGWTAPRAFHWWVTSGTYMVKVQARCNIHPSVVSPWSKTLTVTVESVSAPTSFSGRWWGIAGVSYVNSTGGSTSDLGDPIQYLFDWGDGTNSGWLPVGKTSTSKFWTSPGNYSVKVKARCSIHNLIISSWYGPFDISVQKVTVLKPSGGEVIPSGSPYTIEWTAPPLTEKFKLLYSVDNGATWKLIASDVTGNNYGWIVPVTAGNKTSCYVKVIGYDFSNVKVGEGRSEKFTIGVVRLVSPNAPMGGEVLRSGDPYTIAWEINWAKSPVTTQKLYYSMDGGATWSLITTLDGVPRTYAWTVPKPPANMAGCYVKVVAYGGSTIVGSDRSAKPFTIEGVRLVSPNGGEVLWPGTIYPIAWGVNGTKSPVTTQKLYYSMDGGATWSLITTLDGAPRNYVWTVPTPPGNKANCYVKVVAYGGSTVVGSDRSEKPFTINAVRLFSPNGGEVLESGSNYSIQWEISGTKYPVATVKLYYSVDGGVTWNLIITLNGSHETYDWTVPVPTSNKNSCYVKVVGYSASNVKVGEDKSDRPFTIGVVKLLGPNGGQVFESGTSYPIQWEIYGTKNPVATVRLYYSMDGGTTWSLITTLDGWFTSYINWLPLVQTTKTKCKVKVVITDTKGVTSSDVSDGYFTIQP